MALVLALFEKLVMSLLQREGGYVNHPDDRGGPTAYGITEAVAREHGYAGSMQALTRAQAIEIYRQRYWIAPGFDGVACVSAAVAEELFDTGVNMGPQVAGRFLQRALNALNRNERDFADLAVDGVTGPKTRDALAAFLKVRGTEGEAVLLNALRCLKGERYVALAESRSANESFVYGWLKNRVGVGVGGED